eukprot:TRINITY_DN4468_c0_g1_i2.p1 TRINITY_DN4468_c0_g1~~TRINITY_DN4468_c0_g1_i2.p1  ORF type:complete len:125 (+),score=14.42 TRINITY_DN4468_c0_g1_i2:217-591(+)
MNVHGFHSVVIWLDIVVLRVELYVNYCFVPIICSIIYLAFNAIYVFAGGCDAYGFPYIYSALDWNAAPFISLLVGIGVILFGMMAFMVHFGLTRLRNKFVKLENFTTADGVKLSTIKQEELSFV